jgi:hypothetical protein
MTAWEYLIFALPEFVAPTATRGASAEVQALDDLGEQGWEGGRHDGARRRNRHGVAQEAQEHLARLRRDPVRGARSKLVDELAESFFDGQEHLDLRDREELLGGHDRIVLCVRERLFGSLSVFTHPASPHIRL